MRYKTILFDADDTLFDFGRAERNALLETFSDLGKKLHEEDIVRYSAINKTLWERFERGEITREKLMLKRFELFAEYLRMEIDCEQVGAGYIGHMAQESFLLDDSLEVCRRLSESCSLYIITNGMIRTQRGRFERSELRRYFKDIFISEEIGVSKPSKEFFDYCLRHIDSYAIETLVVGDSLSADIEGANNAALDCCWFNPGGRPKTKQLRIDYEIKRLTELYDIIGK